MNRHLHDGEFMVFGYCLHDSEFIVFILWLELVLHTSAL